MPTINAAAISSLRVRTGVSILECKKALEEAGGDEEKAIDILRKKGIAQAAKKAAREQMEGGIFEMASGGKSALVVLKCETDFVARNEAFIELGTKLAHILHEEGEDRAKAVAAEKIPDAVQKLGENISVAELHLFEAPVTRWHLPTNRNIGTIIGLDKGTQEQARDVAMHAAAFNPSFVRPEDVSEEVVAKEKEIWREQLKKEGKPEQIWNKIMIGKEKKFREESALLKQPFAKDQSKSVEQYLGDAKIVEYIRVAIP